MAIGFNEFKKRIATRPNDPYNDLVDKYTKSLKDIDHLTRAVKEFSKSERRQYVQNREKAKKELKFEKERAKAIKSNLKRMSMEIKPLKRK